LLILSGENSPAESRGDIMEKPLNVFIAVGLMYCSTAINLIENVVLDPLGHVHRSPVGTITGLLLGFALASFIFQKIFNGRNWARILMAVLYLVFIGLTLLILPKLLEKSYVSGVIFLIQTVLQVTALILLFTDPGKQWFKSRDGSSFVQAQLKRKQELGGDGEWES
jgi:hypothetical protein